MPQPTIRERYILQEKGVIDRPVDETVNLVFLKSSGYNRSGAININSISKTPRNTLSCINDNIIDAENTILPASDPIAQLSSVENTGGVQQELSEKASTSSTYSTNKDTEPVHSTSRTDTWNWEAAYVILGRNPSTPYSSYQPQPMMGPRPTARSRQRSDRPPSLNDIQLIHPMISVPTTTMNIPEKPARVDLRRVKGSGNLLGPRPMAKRTCSGDTSAPRKDGLSSIGQIPTIMLSLGNFNQSLPSAECTTQVNLNHTSREETGASWTTVEEEAMKRLAIAKEELEGTELGGVYLRTHRRLRGIHGRSVHNLVRRGSSSLKAAVVRSQNSLTRILSKERGR